MTNFHASLRHSGGSSSFQPPSELLVTRALPSVGKRKRETFGIQSARLIVVGRPVLVAVAAVTKYRDGANTALFAKVQLAVTS
ncbi:hypothetical protein M3J09_012735 [Ascochyta lentis]